MSGRAQLPIASAGRHRKVATPVRNPTLPTLRATLFEAACDAAIEAEVEAAIDVALAPYDDDLEPPMIGFRETLDDDPLGCPECAICQMLNAEYGPAELVPLPDGTYLEIRHRRGSGRARGCP